MDRDNYFSEDELQEKIDRFESLLLEIERPGIKKLLGYIRKYDFYTAPADWKYYNAVKGGLLDHTLNVYDCLESKLWEYSDRSWPVVGKEVKLPRESILITGLCHGLYKTRLYTNGYRNVKVYDPDVVREETERGNYAKSDDSGQYVWITEREYGIDDQFPYGRGEKSVKIIDSFGIKLTGTESMMIRWHSEYDRGGDLRATFLNAVEKYPAILALVEANMEAMYYLDVRG